MGAVYMGIVLFLFFLPGHSNGAVCHSFIVAVHYTHINTHINTCYVLLGLLLLLLTALM